MAIDREKVLVAAQKYVEKKKYDKAVIEYQKLIQEDPNDARTLLKIGDLQSKMDAYEGAVATYERVGKFYAQQGFALKAIAVFKQIREIIAKHTPQLEERYGHIAPKLAELYQHLGLTSDALAALDEVATRYQRQGRDPEAIDVFRKIVDLDPTNPLPHLRLAEALSRVKDVDGAVQEFSVAGSQLVKLGRRDDAIKVIERLLHHKADATHARVAAELYLARGQGSDGLQALAKLQLCFQANPKDLDTLALLARAFTAIGQAAKSVEVQKEMARIAKEQGKTELFKQLVEKLMRLAPNDEGVRALIASPAPQQQAPLETPPQNDARARNRAPAPPQPQPPPQRQPPQRPQPGARIDELSYEHDVESAEIDADEDQEPAHEVEREAPQPRHAAAQAQPDPDDFDADEPPSLSTDVTLEDSYEAPEPAHEVGPAHPPDARTRLARILSDATSFRRARFYAKAIESLRSGIEIAPRSTEVREVLRDVLLEAGRHHEAVGEMLTLASLQIDALDGDSAANTLQDVLAIDPQNIRAAEMLRELGYELVEEGAPSVAPAEIQEDYLGAPGDGATVGTGLPPMRAEYTSYDPEAPLPSYDLEEIGPEDVAPRAYSDPLMRAASPIDLMDEEPGAGQFDAGGGLSDIDDPFGDGPLPSFPLDPAAESEASFDLVAPRDGAPAARQGDVQFSTAAYDAQSEQEHELEVERTLAAPQKLRLDSVKTDASMRLPTPPPERSSETATGPAPMGAEMEEALEEAEFFTSRGLFDDARTILEEQLSRLPNHPLLRERLSELDAQERGTKGGSGTREKPNGASHVDDDGAIDLDRSFDIAATLDAMEEQQPQGITAPVDQQVDVEEVFAKFKDGVAKQISVDDAQAHYDLGGAYKEMGLLEDAIREFEVAARDKTRECVCQSMIGMIQVERGNLNEAIDAFMRGLNSKARTAEQEMVLSFEIGAVHELKKNAKEALRYYAQVARRDTDYRDVQERIRRLQGTVKAPRAAAMGADDEFDRAFDDILGGGKLP